MKRTRIKICGLTRPEDARAAVACGVDAVGIVFVHRSARFVNSQRGAEICAAVTGFTRCVGLFMNDSAAWVAQVLKEVPLDMLQFHGDEDEPFCRSFERPYLKALSHRQAGRSQNEYRSAAAVILDGHDPGEMGGSGRSFDWARFPRSGDRRFILAGGLKPSNVAAAIRQAQPYGVDVSSGVESRPGVKDYRQLEQFVVEVQGADSNE